MQIPSSLIQSLQAVKGFQQQAFEAAHTVGPVTSLRIHSIKHNYIQFSNVGNNEVLAQLKQQNNPIPWCNNGYYLTERPSFITDPFIHTGVYYVQEASSMFLQFALEQIMPNNKHAIVLDACAAPGGKTTLLSNYFSNGIIVANEVIKSRAAILVENCTKWGNDNIVVVNNDVKQIGGLKHFFDVMVVDAPCSGSGLFRKDEKAIEEWSEQNVQLCSERQQRIMADLLPALKPGGKIIYCTCSYSEAENEQIVDWLMEEYQLASLSLPILASWGIVETESAIHKGLGYRFFPNLVKGEGFFMAVLEKTIDNNVGYLPEQKFTIVNASINQLINSQFLLPSSVTIIEHQQQFIGIPSYHTSVLQILAKHLYIKKMGVLIGELKGKDIVPNHALSMYAAFRSFENIVMVNKEQALNFLKRQPFEIEHLIKGWCLIQYCGLNLGWIKVLPNRLNNYYPTEWRILKE